MALQDVCIEVFFLTAAHGFQKIAMMIAAAVEFFTTFPFRSKAVPPE